MSKIPQPSKQELDALLHSRTRPVQVTVGTLINWGLWLFVAAAGAGFLVGRAVTP